ncbi:thioredoxin family protein [Noviherbaspirillum aerium]|uniref:thioredoxin family protein n=1 Tax=Noviherbaspirillum aerium TaxID=2588497 RepID=UPI00124E45B1|nr:thioredoxin family protein [Noviherbaspirillum aerium]
MRRSVLVVMIVVAAFCASIASIRYGMNEANASETASIPRPANDLPVQGAIPKLEGAVTWLNSAPLTPAQLRGKVVLVDFWTYSCINCIRTFPYIRAWADKYRDKGLVVLGVHTPEFQFEQDLANIHTAMKRFMIDFPVAVDSNHRIWQAFGNRAWPAIYLVDPKGNIRYRQLGEGHYDKTERAIQALLAEAGKEKVPTDLVHPTASDEQMAPDVDRIGSEETYIGYEQSTNLRSPESVRKNALQTYSVGELALNDWGLFGAWTVMADRGTVSKEGSGIAYRFSARDLHLVLGPGAAGKPVRIRVTIDGRAPGADHGADIDEEGNGVISQTRLYQLVRQAGKVSARRFEIRFLDTGAEAYAFTFG